MQGMKIPYTGCIVTLHSGNWVESDHQKDITASSEGVWAIPQSS